ncbi:hypothetical protein TanjilG_26517 [Lupinus angustifolius]|uniref:FAS1 domain-containing protein n=1 Tax=Lupinus angustifolius TaxID=3871 RepID=A0A4P1QPI7_LUPAN|nr:hypothetical protein TanjilG_26517 [Lupinus angustifolius]
MAAPLLSAFNVVEEFKNDEDDTIITLYIPVNNAFADLPPSVSLQSPAADKKVVVLKFHVLHSYYHIGSLEFIVNSVQPTLATETMGVVSLTPNILHLNYYVAFNTSIV